MAEAVAVSKPPLDDLMMAMDVVDTLRHREALVERELRGDERRAKMIERLREIYASQGIAVTDRILAEGVDALEQERFVYKPRQGGFSFTLARLWVRRAAVFRNIGIGVATLVIGTVIWFFAIEQPRQRGIEADRQAAEALIVELGETIPADLTRLSTAIAEEANDPAVAAAAAVTASDGRTAAATGDAEAARAAVASLEATLAELQLTYEVQVVSRPGERSGVNRIPDANPTARNYYLIVHAIGPDGNAIPRSITSEEDGTTRTVTEWGLRVPESVYNAVAADKTDDGIIQNDVVGEKARGDLDVTWTMAVLGGAITNW